MPIHTVAEALPAAPPSPDVRESLPPIMVGERAEIEREHRWPGSLFYSLSYVVAIGLGAGAVGCAGWGVFQWEPTFLGLAVLLGSGAAVQGRLAREVENFSRWGWYGAMVELAGAAVAKVWGMAHGNVAGGIVGLGIDLLWMRYFWENRRQFDVDFDG
jgi:hypothetical protein